jgi:transcriptional regulator with XRE-family HTH domain
LGTKIGRILEQARKEQGLSLKQVEQATKIRARYLKELEGGNFGVLPAVYVRGSLRTYADHLGLDGEALTRELKHQQVAPEERTTPIYAEPSESDPDRSLVSASSPPAGAEGRATTEDKEDVSSPFIPVGGFAQKVGLVHEMLGISFLRATTSDILWDFLGKAICRTNYSTKTHSVSGAALLLGNIA